MIQKKNVNKIKIAVCMIVTSNYAFSVATTAQGVIENNKDYDFIFYIYHNGIKKEDKNILDKILINTVYIDFSDDFFHNSVRNLLKNEYEKINIQKLLDTRKFYFIGKVCCLELLKFNSNVLYLDTDLLIQGSLHDIFKNKGVSWRPAFALARKKLSTITTSKVFFNQIPTDYTAPNAGVMFFTDDIPYEKMLAECYLVLQNYHHEMRADLDEAVIAWACYKYDVKINKLEYKYNQWAYSTNKNTIISHTIGNINFWDANFRKIIFNEWNKYYNNWLQLGGSSCESVPKDIAYIKEASDIGKLALTFEHMLFWEKFYQQLDSSYPENLYRSGPMAESYSKLLIRNIPKYIHYEIEVVDLTGNPKIVVKFFVKNKKALTSKIYNDLLEFFSNKNFYIVNRTDFLEISSKPVNTKFASSMLHELCLIIESEFPELYQKF